MSEFDEIYKLTQPVPHASGSGGQEGVVPPAKKKYEAGIYKLVTNGEAVANMQARREGSMERIVGGVEDIKIEDSELTAPEPDVKAAASLSRPEKNPEPVNMDLTDDDETVEDPKHESLLKEVAQALRDLRADAKADSRYDHGDPGPNIANPFNEIGQYGHYNETKTITMEIRQEHQDGTFTSIMTVGLPVSHVLQNSSSITLITPITNNQYTFQPTAGSDILLNGGGLNNVHVFYPGTSFVLDEYKISGMCFVKAK